MKTLNILLDLLKKGIIILFLANLTVLSKDIKNNNIKYHLKKRIKLDYPINDNKILNFPYGYSVNCLNEIIITSYLDKNAEYCNINIFDESGKIKKVYSQEYLNSLGNGFDINSRYTSEAFMVDTNDLFIPTDVCLYRYSIRNNTLMKILNCCNCCSPNFYFNIKSNYLYKIDCSWNPILGSWDPILVNYDINKYKVDTIRNFNLYHDYVGATDDLPSIIFNEKNIGFKIDFVGKESIRICEYKSDFVTKMDCYDLNINKHNSINLGVIGAHKDYIYIIQSYNDPKKSNYYFYRYPKHKLYIINRKNHKVVKQLQIISYAKINKRFENYEQILVDNPGGLMFHYCQFNNRLYILTFEETGVYLDYISLDEILE